MAALSILFTNNTLSWRAGSELWVRDMCRALVGRGHHPVAFSLVTGAIAEELRSATVPVVTNLDQIGFTPNLIHGHHHVETLIAALHFPGVPIVHFCHGWLPWEEGPLRHPSIVRYVAVDETCADRLTAENGIGRHQVDLLLNFVDMRQFLPRESLPSRPRRALIVSNHAVPGQGFADTIREACREQHLELEIIGASSGRSVARPQDVLPGFDLIFAKGRAALEALAVGCSVILADHIGGGPLVTERNFDRLRAGNFGVRWLQQTHTVDWYRAQIATYDGSEAERIAARVRTEADLESAVDRLLDIYTRTLDEHHTVAGSNSRGMTDAAVAQRAAARHLSAIALRFKQAQTLDTTVQTLSDELMAVRADREHGVRERQQLIARIDATANELTLARAAEQQLVHEHDRLRQECQVLVGRVEALINQLAAAHQSHLDLTNDRDRLQRLVDAYRALPSLHLRDMLIRIPVVGRHAQGIARRLNARLMTMRAGPERRSDRDAQLPTSAP